jgi:hypothetical protein
MVMSTAPAVYLRLSDGAIIGTPTAMKASDAAVVGTGGALIANSLLPALPPMTPTSTNGDAASSAVQGAPGTTTTGGSVASTPGVLPSPVTH